MLYVDRLVRRIAAGLCKHVLTSELPGASTRCYFVLYRLSSSIGKCRRTACRVL